MKNQYRVSFYKLRRCPFVYLGALLLIALNAPWGYLKLSTVAGMDMYGAFQDACCDTSFTFVMTLVSSWFVGNDFGNRTIQHEIKLGYSRASVIAARALPVFFVTIILHFIIIVSAMLGVGIKVGFSLSGFGMQDMWQSVTIALQIIAFQSIIVFLVFAIRNFGAAIIAAVCFTFVTCNMLRNFIHSGIFLVSCFCLVRENTTETLFKASFLAVAVTGVMFVAACAVFQKAEIR
ncbi:MAG: ABC transporter permease [Roseburia sp.]|nr:ABC transporter permease [Ruminococcus sp.]MCM1155399.1 ABC transporter permease [Roseburia sp.]MCM1243237.1 ABC transporter permease [Roseburia sp.]